MAEVPHSSVVKQVYADDEDHEIGVPDGILGHGVMHSAPSLHARRVHEVDLAPGVRADLVGGDVGVNHDVPEAGEGADECGLPGVVLTCEYQAHGAFITHHKGRCEGSHVCRLRPGDCVLSSRREGSGSLREFVNQHL